MAMFDFWISFIRDRLADLEGGIFDVPAKLLGLALVILIIIWYVQYMQKKQKKAMRLMSKIEEDLTSFKRWLERVIR